MELDKYIFLKLTVLASVSHLNSSDYSVRANLSYNENDVASPTSNFRMMSRG